MNILRSLKNLCPMNLMFLIKYYKKFNHQKCLNSGNKKRIYFLDSPNYANLGDQAIALAIEKYAKSYFNEYDFIEIQQDDLAVYSKCLKQIIKSEDIIFLTGGGNMGNIYPIYEAARRFVIKNFPNNKIIVFPQTIDYTYDTFGSLSIKKSQSIYNKHKNLTLMAREKNSYKKMKELYLNCKVLLMPDIVLTLDFDNSDIVRQNIGICLRGDKESLLTNENKDYIISQLNALNLTYEKVTTSTDICKITNQNRSEIVWNKLENIAKYKLLITDRLHGMIFAAITNTPCIVFDNTNRKVSGVYKWLEKYEYIKFIKEIDCFQYELKEIIANKFKFKFDNSNFSKNFKTILKE